MNEMLRYLFLSGISAILFYAIYAFFLARDTFFMVNRIYLLGSIFVSLLIPFVPNLFSEGLQNLGYAYLLETIIITPEKIQTTVVNHFSLFQTVFIIYVTGASLFFARFIFQLLQLAFFVKKFGITRKEGLNLIFINHNYSPFSFFNLIFINDKETGTVHFNNILEHEKVHVRQRHTLDLTLVEMLTVIQWFNPVVWFYRHSFKVLHEYLADEGVLVKGIDRKNYQEQLLEQALGIQVNDLTNNFNHSLLKRRIIMMTKSKSPSTAKWKFLFAFPVMLALALIFTSSSGNLALVQNESVKGSKESMQKPPSGPGNTAQPISQTADAGKKLQENVISQPQFPGGYEKLTEYIIKNVKYPEDAKKAGTTGTVLVCFTVNAKGKVTNAKIQRSVSESLDAEALRVIKGMPDWIPGKDEKGEPVAVTMTLPIGFALDEKNKK